MNLLGASLTLLAAMIVVFAPSRWAALGVLAAVSYITQGQLVNVGGFSFHAIRMVLLAGFIRVVVRSDLRKVKMISIDWIVLAYTILTGVLTGIRVGVWQEQAGIAYNVLLSYFVFRALVTSWEDAQGLIGGLALLIVPVALCMAMESLTGTNVFNVFGGQEATSIREGRYRCVGAFRGPHTAGIFGATLMPLFAGLFFVAGQRRAVAVAGIAAATVITYTSNSSGPLMAYLSALIGLGFWRMRMDMRTVRRGIIATLIAYGLLSKAPIWYLISKISSLTGGDGWHRSYLMEQCYKHFPDWWLMGTNDTSEWAVTTMSWGGADMTNMYVSCAAGAGLGGLVLFILILVRCFKNLGLALQGARESLPECEILLWCLGAALFAHVVTLFSVTYWDQMQVAWWGILAIIASVTSDVLKRAPATEFVAEPPESSPNEEGVTPFA